MVQKVRFPAKTHFLYNEQEKIRGKDADK